MCRHLARLGAPVTLHELLYEPPHALFGGQAHAPRHQVGGTINADGFGVGWYVDGRAAPVRYRRAQPVWTDASFADVSEVAASGCALAAVRSATPGFPVEETCAAPFAADHWLFSHNGRVNDFAEVENKLRGGWGDLRPPADARAPVDSALLFTSALARWRRGWPLGEALAQVVVDVARVSRSSQLSRLNLLATDGRALAATTFGDSLFYRGDGGATTLASEPCDDDPAWREVPPGVLVTVDGGGMGVTELPLTPPHGSAS